jgi:hypothetical protein
MSPPSGEPGYAQGHPDRVWGSPPASNLHPIARKPPSLAEITLTAGEETTIEIVNNDSMPHDFAIESLDLNAGTVEPGETVVTTVVATKDTTSSCAPSTPA